MICFALADVMTPGGLANLGRVFWGCQTISFRGTEASRANTITCQGGVIMFLIPAGLSRELPTVVVLGFGDT